METIPYYYYGLPLFDVKPFEEGTEPVPFDFHVHDTYPPVIMRGYNFSGDTLPAGIPILLVLDMFQRLVYSKKVQEEPIITAQLGRIEEPVVSSPYRRYTPNFVGTNLEGILIEKSRRDILPTYKHHLSCGFVRLEGKYYAPIQATHEGGEEYLNDDGMLSIRFRGDLRFDREGRALYLLGRKVSRDSRYFALHQDFYFARNRTGNHAFNNSLHSDSPFLFEYLDGRECNFNINPIPIGGVFPEEWELTTDFTKAQYNYDICLAPDAADGECFVKGEVLCFRRKVALMKAPAFRQNGTLIENVWRWSAYTYYEAIPYPEYLEPLRGQGKTKSYYFRSLPHRIEVVSVNSADRPDVSHYARLQLVDNSGLPELHNEERVCRLCEYFPSRGVFYKMDEDGIRYPIIVTPDTSEGSGIPTATAHQAFDEITHQCTTVVEHKQHRIIRQGAELLLTAVSECWRQCGMIEGTIPPDLGDPRALPKRIIFVETRTDVTGQMPDITSLMSGTFLNLVTGQLFAYSEYRSAMPMYPPAPDPAVMWNPGELSRPGFDFLGFVTYRNAPEPLFMLSGDLPAHTLFPVWQHRNATREFVRVTFCGCNFPGDNSWQVGNKTATMQVPKGMVLDTKYYNPINVPEINPEHGFYFGGWSNSVHGTIAITCNSDMILRPVASDSPLPLEDGEHWVTFVGGEINPVPFKAADEMELDLKQFIVSSENRIFLGWSTEVAGEIIEEYEIHHDITFYAQFQQAEVLYIHTVTFEVGETAAKKFFDTLPDPITVKYGSELDLMGYGDERMRAYGLHFGGWSTNPNFQTPIPRIVVTANITLYAVWYTARLPYNKPRTCAVSFGGRTELMLNRSSVLRLKGFNPDMLSSRTHRFLGWHTVPDANEPLFHLVIRADTFLYPVWQEYDTATISCGCGDYIL